MNLTNNQFLKIKTSMGGNLYFEIYEVRRGVRPLRWSLIVGISRLVNRHKKESKIKLIVESVETVYASFLYEFDQIKYIREFVKKPIDENSDN